MFVLQSNFHPALFLFLRLFLRLVFILYSLSFYPVSVYWFAFRTVWRACNINTHIQRPAAITTLSSCGIEMWLRMRNTLLHAISDRRDTGPGARRTSELSRSHSVVLRSCEDFAVSAVSWRWHAATLRTSMRTFVLYKCNVIALHKQKTRSEKIYFNFFFMYKFLITTIKCFKN